MPEEELRNGDLSGSGHTLELRLLNEAALVLVNDLEDIFDLLGRLRGQARHLEELLVAE